MPQRSPGGQRLYSDGDVERLQLLRRLTQRGHAIGQVAALETSVLREMVMEHELGVPPVQVGDSDQGQAGAARCTELRADAMRQIEALEGQRLETLLRRITQQQGIAAVIEEVVTPVMREVGDRWHRGELDPAHEHLATSVIERTLHWMLDGTTQPDDAPRIAMATTQGERHEMGIQVATAIAASEGWRAVYLGADLPADAIVQATIRSGARVLGISVATAAGMAIEELRKIRAGLPARTGMILGGSGAAAITNALPPGITRLADLAALRAYLHSFRSASTG